ncbi:MAG: M20/M25/M40 family metallo-hydrolase [Desulfovibrio sp.]|jgi:glutamate carboxypeptidase|nr:M20/M25/M40 family metallo-hydrolase [Desulfovibrio sp.]
MEDANLLQYSKDNLESLLSMLQEFVELESPSHEDKAVSDRCGQYLFEHFGRLGFSMEKIPQDTCGDHLYGELGKGAKNVLLVGHYDTVFPVGTLNTMPFRRRDKENKIYGPGVLDMKGGIIMAYFAVKALLHLGLFPQHTVGVFFNSDEESGSFSSSSLIVTKARQYRHVLVMEPGGTHLNYVKTSRSGRGTYEVIAKGIAAHSGTNPDKAISPIEEVSRQILRIKEWNDGSEGLSLTPTWIHGGIKGTCMVPEEASFSMDVRAISAELCAEAERRIRTMEPLLPGVKLRVEGGIDKPVMRADSTLFETARAFGKAFGLDLQGIHVGGGSDGNFTAAAGASTLDGLGVTGDLLHNIGEFAYIDHIPPRTALVAKLLLRL